MKFETLMYIHTLLKNDLEEKGKAYEQARENLGVVGKKLADADLYCDITTSPEYRAAEKARNDAWDASDDAQEAFNDFMNKEWN